MSRVPLSLVPFSLDRKKVVRRREDLAKVYAKIAKKTGRKTREIGATKVGVNRPICGERDVPPGRVVVRLTVGKEAIDVCVLPYKHKVVGFAD